MKDGKYEQTKQYHCWHYLSVRNLPTPKKTCIVEKGVKYETLPSPYSYPQKIRSCFIDELNAYRIDIEYICSTPKKLNNVNINYGSLLVEEDSMHQIYTIWFPVNSYGFNGSMRECKHYLIDRFKLLETRTSFEEELYSDLCIKHIIWRKRKELFFNSMLFKYDPHEGVFSWCWRQFCKFINSINRR